MPTLALAGDTMLGRGVDDALAEGLTPDELWGDVLPLLQAADLRLLNLECALTRHPVRWRFPKVFHFRADPERALACLKRAGIDAVSLANNHVLDHEEQGLLDTLAALDAAGIRHAGAGRNLDEASAPALLNAAGTRVGLVSLTDNEPDFAATASRPGTLYLPIEISAETMNLVGGAIERARTAGAALVVVSAHWGPNMELHPPAHFRAFARATLDLGADLFHGHSAHLFQGVELYGGRPILYDTGDFVDDYAVDPALRNDWSFLFRARFEGSRFTRLELTPLRLHLARVRQARGIEAGQIRRRMEALSAELGTSLRRDGEALVLEPADAAHPAP